MRAGVIAVVLLLMGACWWVLRDAEDSEHAPIAAPDATVGQGLPAPDASVTRLPEWTGEAPQSVLPAAAPRAGGPAVGNTAPARVEIAGRVLDSTGSPIAGADVWFLPSGQTLRSSGFDVPLAIPFVGLGRQGPELLMDVPLAALEHVTTDDAGGFVIAGAADKGYSARDPYPAPGIPQLVVRRAGFAIGLRGIASEAPVELRLRKAA